jgi:ubiquinone/menaquinone biosynthesis C-methylase UbiE
VGSKELLEKVYPEIGAGGFTSLDGSIEFYGRIKGLLDSDMTVLDFGAGRGAWFEDDSSAARKTTRLVRGSVKRVIGCDVDPAILDNRSIDEAIAFQPGETLPIEASSVDLIICDYVFEHVTNVDWLSAEFKRVLRPGGWICARTPTRYCYVALFARIVRNRQHSAVLKRAQPSRKEIDVFPTAYQLNSLRQLASAFPGQDFENYSYLYSAEPSYHFGNIFLFRLLQFVHWLAPKWFTGNLFVFLRKN